MPLGLSDTLRRFRLSARKPARRRRPVSTPVAAEILESRQMLSAVAAGVEVRLHRGTLDIRGTSGDDTVDVTVKDGDVRVAVIGADTRTFKLADVSRLRFRGFEGSDSFVNGTDLRSDAWGGDGDDSLTGGGARDRLFGGRGDDRLVGGDGRDLLAGGTGTDVEVQDGPGPNFGVKNAPSSVSSVTSDLRYGMLVVRGTSNADTIRVTLSGAAIAVTGGSGTSFFDARAVTHLVIEAGSGNDLVDVSEAITLPAYIYGGYGNDAIYAGGGSEQVYGGHGTDVINGRGGNDLVAGGAGVDNVAGGGQADNVVQDTVGRTGTLSALENEIVRLVNLERTRNGLAALAVGPRLIHAAAVHSDNMARMSGVIGNDAAHSHALWGVTTPTPGSRLDYAGVQHSAYAENIAYGYSTAASVVAAWMNSAGHRANILSSTYTHTGFAVRYNAAGVPFYTQMFVRAV